MLFLFLTDFTDLTSSTSPSRSGKLKQVWLSSRSCVGSQIFASGSPAAKPQYLCYLCYLCEIYKLFICVTIRCISARLYRWSHIKDNSVSYILFTSKSAGISAGLGQ